MKTDPFSLATDGSNDTGLNKVNPLTISICDAKRGSVITRLDICLISESTAEAIFFKNSWNNTKSWSGLEQLSVLTTQV